MQMENGLLNSYLRQSTWMAAVFSNNFFHLMHWTLIIFLASVLSSAASILPADRMGPWARANVGVEGGIPDSSQMTIYTTIPTGASLMTINNALAACPSNQVVQLSAGTYTCGGNIVVPTGVVLRGAGMSNTIVVFTSGGISVSSIAMYNALRSGSYSGGGSANWTAGYAQGTSNLTFSTTSPGLTVGNIVYLDQSDDNYFVNNFGYAGMAGGARNDTHTMCQFTKVTAVNGNTVTVWPPIAATWFTSSLNPGAIWIGKSAWISRVGIENLTVDGTSSTGTGGVAANIDMECVRDCWVKGVRSLNGRVTHVLFGYGAFRCELRDSYIYGTQGATSQSYGIDLMWASSCLCENNVFEKMVGAILPHASPSCNVFTYNYVTNEWYTSSANFLMAGAQPHQSHSYMELFEGNHFTKYDGDFLHGSHSHEVLFRNRITGWEAYSYPSGETLNNMQCIKLDITNRYCSSVGNILGTSGKYSTYQVLPGGSYGINGVIYQIGLHNPNTDVYGYGGGNWPDDTQTSGTFYRHMDYDVVRGGITYNATNADVTLPASLVYSSKPSFFGNLAWPPFNPTNVTAAAISPTNIPAGYWRVYGHYPASGPATNPPSITSQPQNTWAATNTTATFSVTATGDGTLAYQWQWYGTNVAAATASSWTTPALSIEHSNSAVAVGITNAYGGVLSATAYLWVSNVIPTAPSITVQPTSQSVVTNTTATFTVTASGTAPLTYQWKLAGTNVTGSTSSAWSYTPQVAQTNTVQCGVTNSAGGLLSSQVYLYVTKSTAGAGHTYTTSFPLTENPISEGGNWINGGTVGLDWANVRTTPGFAYSASGLPSIYGDPTAVLTGTWGPTQTVSAVVKINATPSGGEAEVELRLRSSISAHNITGYEFNYAINGSYAQIVRWNGPLGSFTYLGNSAPNGALATGDVLRATITNSAIYYYRNNVLLGTATDSTFTSGSPGIGFYPNSSTLNWGFSSFTATDGAGSSAKPVIAPPALVKYSTTPQPGTAPLAVQFECLVANATNWVFNFGDGKSSTNINPIYTYSTPGTYTFTLRVTGADGGTAYYTNTITVGN
jgi:hypothetical protein